MLYSTLRYMYALLDRTCVMMLMMMLKATRLAVIVGVR